MNQSTRRTLFFIVVLVVFLLMIGKYYWRFSLFFGGEDLSMYTPERFTLPDEFVSEYDRHVKLGRKEARHKSIVICSLLRDAEEKIDDLVKRVEKLGEMFRDYRVLIVENDSSDKTREKLLEWASHSGGKVRVLGCGVNIAECKMGLSKTEGHSVYYKRIEKMSRLRNIYLDYIRENLTNFDYIAVWDMDILGSIYLDGVQNTLGYFSEDPSIDAICAYGIYTWGPLSIYYDTYAHQEEGDEFNIELKFPLDLYNGLFVRYSRGEPIKKVKSCFSGFTLYRSSSLMSTSYAQPDPENLRCEHSTLHDQLKNIYLNPSLINLVMKND